MLLRLLDLGASCDQDYFRAGASQGALQHRAEAANMGWKLLVLLRFVPFRPETSDV